ncbi:MAG: DUF484 family protein [Rhodovibrionaceae bacterium]
MPERSRSNTPRNGETAPKTKTPPGDLPRANEAQVAAFLRRHPDFLRRNPELLDAMQPPGRDKGAGVVDLQQVMVERLREELGEARQQRDELLAMGRGNLASQARIHKVMLDLLAARSFERLIETVTTDLAIALDLDIVALCVERPGDGAPTPPVAGVKCLEPGSVDAIFGPGRSILLHSDVSGDPEIFGSAAGLVASEAMMRLTISSATPPALLAFGARQTDHFHDGQGTELLAFLAQAIERLIRAWLELPE